jgi:hypothetical protein
MKTMIWETPSFEELRMDAEIGSYQQDDDRDDRPIVFVGVANENDD